MSERLEDIISHRKEKVQNIQKSGMEPYPSSVSRTHENNYVLDHFDELQGKDLGLVGRIRSKRVMGKLAFAHLQDGTGKIQVLLKADTLGENRFQFFVDNFDIGDFLEAHGQIFTTKTGEKTLLVSNYRMLAKSLRPLPSEHFGLEDIELKLRKRYLDILLDPMVRELFKTKARFWSSMREFMEKHGFFEVQMPVLESIPGGAEARPFITHHNALDRDFYLRISLELPLKKMLVGGYEKVYEIGRIFRNEGIDTEHLQDYTQIEFYWAYASFGDLMEFTRKLYQHVILETFGTLVIESRGVTCDWSGQWQQIDYFKLFKEHTGIDLETATEEELRLYADGKKIKYEIFARRGRLIDLIFKEVRKKIPPGKPVFLVNQPIELEPLAKRDPGNPKAVQRMQIIAYGTELGKGFGELNDPLDQRRRFEEQMKLREAGDEEAQILDEEYMEAMEYGMPLCAGFGVSERLFSFLADRPIRETVIFPPMKDEASIKHEAKAKDTLMAVAIINKGARLLPWQELNAVAHLTAAFGAREGRPLIFQDEIATADHKPIKLNIQHAIIIKTADSNSQLRKLVSQAKSARLHVAEFTREMIETSSDKKVIEMTAKKNFDEVEYLGVLVFGSKAQAEALTEEFKLYE